MPDRLMEAVVVEPRLHRFARVLMRRNAMLAQTCPRGSGRAMHSDETQSLLLARVEGASGEHLRLGLVRRSARMAWLNAWVMSAKSHFRRRHCSAPFPGTRSGFPEGCSCASIGHRSVANREADGRVIVLTWAKAQATAAEEPVRIGCASGSWQRFGNWEGRPSRHAPAKPVLGSG